jgi:hypothetical protein
MADDSPFPPSKRGKNPRSLGNLRPRRKGDPPLNPTGSNGRQRSEVIAAFLEEKDDTPIGKALMAKVGCPDGTRIRGLLYREWLAGMGKSDMARKTLLEQYGGKPRVQMEVSGPNGGPISTDNVSAILSLEEMAARFLRATRIAQEVLAAEAAPPKAIDAIEVGAQPAAPAAPLAPGQVPIEAIPAPVLASVPMPAVQHPALVQTGAIPRK